MNRYIKEIENFYLSLRKTSVLLSSKERELILKWQSEKIPLKVVKEIIKREFVRFPVRKQKKFNLFVVDKQLRELLKKQKEKSFKTEKDIPKQAINKTEDRISTIWKTLSEKDKNRIKEKAISQLKGLRLSKEERKEALKILIRKLIKEEYLSD